MSDSSGFSTLGEDIIASFIFVKNPFFGSLSFTLVCTVFFFFGTGFFSTFGFSGFVSKDAILEGMFASNSYSSLGSFWFLLFAAFITTLYSLSLIHI